MTDITRKRGDTYADEFTITYKSTGLPVNLTGYTFVLTVDSSKAPVDESTKQYSVVGEIIDAINGRVGFAPSSIQANRVGSFFFDAQWIDPLGRIRTFDAGKYVYTQDISKGG
jgi:hypothetical protein